MCKEQSRCSIIFAFPRVCVPLLCAVPQARGPVQLRGAVGTSQLCAPDPIQCAWAPTRTAAPEAAKGNLEALKVLDITQPATVSSTVFPEWSEVFCEVVALWIVSELRSCRVSGIPASRRFVVAAGKSLQGYPEIDRPEPFPTASQISTGECLRCW